jgi:adenylosuccinate synthase
MTSYSELPLELKTYIEFIEKEIEVPIHVVSVGPDRTQTIIK